MARHLVATGRLIDEDPEEALAHAMAARRQASRIAVVREAVGLAAYRAGEWQTAIAELRTDHRMSGRQTHRAVLADCERALGRPERAVDLYRNADREALPPGDAVELLIVAAGARGDLGQRDAAVTMLQVRELTAVEGEPWVARLRYAYADALLTAGRRDEAREWFARAAQADEEAETDAAERLLELDGVVIDDPDDDEDDDGAAQETGGAAAADRAHDDGATGREDLADDDDDATDDEDAALGDEDSAYDDDLAHDDLAYDEDDTDGADDTVDARADAAADVDDPDRPEDGLDDGAEDAGSVQPAAAHGAVEDGVRGAGADVDGGYDEDEDAEDEDAEDEDAEDDVAEADMPEPKPSDAAPSAVDPASGDAPTGQPDDPAVPGQAV
ncbi:MAG TPA: hypothetical protein VES42_04670 [Pilimelia sp.]|nr:hypothetical protein [Pilimelia sp.]